MNSEDILKQSETWYIVEKNKKKGPFSYLEMAKDLDLKKINFDTLVTRRQEDEEGLPIGKISDFSETAVSEFVARISPPHTTLHSSRSFIRVDVEEDAFLKLPFGNKVNVKIKSVSAGGCKVESITRLKGITVEDEIQFIIPSISDISLEPIKVKTNILHHKMLGFKDLHKFETLLCFKKLGFKEKETIIRGILNLTFTDLSPFEEEPKKRRITDLILDKIKNI